MTYKLFKTIFNYKKHKCSGIMFVTLTCISP